MKIDLNEIPQQQELPLDHKRLEAGLFGKIFGTGINASNNIAGAVLIGLLISMVLAWFIETDKSAKFLETVTPIMTLALGYLFGKKES